MRKNNRVITLFILLGGCIFILTPLINPLIQYGERAYLTHALDKTNQYLAAQQQAIDAELTVLEGSSTLKQLVAAKDLVGLQTFAGHVRAQTGFDLVLVTDEHGVALVRTSLSSNRGDYIFNVTAWGQAISQTGRAVTIERGVTFPLIMIGGQQLHNPDGTTVGAVFVGHQISDTYLASYKEHLLPFFMHAIAFTKQDGAVASTFANPTDRTMISYAFSPTSRWSQEIIGINAPEFISLDKHYYFAQSLAFPGLQTSPGGIILLFPYSPFINILVFTSTFTLIYALFAFVYVMEIRSPGKTRELLKKHASYVAGFCAFTLFLAFFANFYYGAENIAYIPQETPVLYNSTLALQPSADIFVDGAAHQVTVSISSGGELINAAEATLTFDPSLVSIQAISLVNSICDTNLFGTTSVDNTNGVASVSCATVPSGFQGQGGILARLTVMPKRVGQYSLAFDMTQTHVFANDGLGTDVLRTATGGSYQIKKSSDSPTMPVLPIFSLSHPNSEQWYNSRAISLSWDPNSQYTSYQYGFDMIATSEPSLPIAKSSVSLLAVQDGVYYFHLAGMRGTVRGPVSHFKIMIDSTKPDAPRILLSSDNAQTGDTVRAQVNSRDRLSGLQRFLYARVNNNMFLPFTSPTSFSFPKSGIYTLTVRAYDNAGNWNESSRTIKVSSPPFFENLKTLLPAAASSIAKYL